MTVQKSQVGFTLIEVMVALSIVALSLTAIAASMNQMIDAANAMRERTYASWIAQNKIAELRLANVLPEVSATSGDVEYANSEWAWRAEVSETGVENFFRVDVSVSHAGSDDVVRTVTGFIGEPVLIGGISRLGGPVRDEGEDTQGEDTR
ncbi:MAG: type II secretion system minor pseudopilin GspI [Gammaproteobacteria bacterium]|nr:type II secretion system minor pseudopilin GspI [Gammaproteobacteria bacterium]